MFKIYMHVRIFVSLCDIFVSLSDTHVEALQESLCETCRNFYQNKNVYRLKSKKGIKT